MFMCVCVLCVCEWVIRNNNLNKYQVQFPSIPLKPSQYLG